MAPDAEAFYDTKIAPVLLDLARKCERRGLSFMALCEYQHGQIGRTQTEQPDSGVEFRLASMAARANGNVDSLIWAIRRYAREHGHNSIELKLMDVGHDHASKDESDE